MTDILGLPFGNDLVNEVEWIFEIGAIIHVKNEVIVLLRVQPDLNKGALIFDVCHFTPKCIRSCLAALTT